MQIHGGTHHAPTLMIRISEGALHYYLRDLVPTDLYDKWFRLNVIHDVDQGTVMVVIDGVESRWNYVKIFKKRVRKILKSFHGEKCIN